MNLTPEEKEVGRDNYFEAVGAYHAFGPEVDRRHFLKTAIGTGLVSGAGLGAMYFGYEKVANPVRVGVIGTGDEGNILIGAINPEFVQVVAIADIRPSSIHRAFHGDWGGGDPNRTHSLRPGLMMKYGWETEDEARKTVKVYDQSNGGYQALIKDPDVEAVIIALPLHLHATAACAAMKAGKHVLTEKLMAHNVAQCKVMGRLAYEQGVYLATGHQRHYSVLYDNAKHLIQWGVLGEIHHIRAQWHRGNLPGKDSWQQPLPGGEIMYKSKEKKPIDRIGSELKKFTETLKKIREQKENATAEEIAMLERRIAQWTAWNSDKGVDAEANGYITTTLSNGRPRPALEELCRWRLWERTGGGLMAELGSHQLDAAGIFVSAVRGDGKKSHPLTVHALGGRHTFPLDRDAGDHVYCMFEFAGPGYEREFDVGYRDKRVNYPNDDKGIPSFDEDPNKKIVVTYSSINGNGFGGYGEVVMGSKGTLVLKQEKEVMLYKTSSTSSRVKVKDDKGGPTMDTQASGEMGPAAKAAETQGPVSRGYTEEIEHWAWCIRNGDGKDAAVQPRCKPEVALGDAVIALTTNVALKSAAKGEPGFVKFEDDWYDLNKDATPDGSSYEEEYAKLVKDA
ncbi:MAG: Gfo/Idh/MocA family oxidoreductase [Planctomycetes bacterium]|nr:Gfo/Idh/MocA family oxidoreductase [Planctomycetota bacterium]MBL7041029.1 Gfo/Idh/MocA family oxidoreductase [Pirellulaceae bacterium]